MFWQTTLLEPSVLGGTTKVSNINDYLNQIFPVFLSFIGLLAVVIIAYNGLLYMFSQIPGMKSDAKKRIWAAVGGLVLALIAYLILNEINPKILQSKIG